MFKSNRKHPERRHQLAGLRRVSRACAVVLFTIIIAGAVAAAPNWSDFKKGQCTSNGYRVYSSMLFDVPASGSWEKACASTPATVSGVVFSGASRCLPSSINIFGEFDVPDPTCVPEGSKKDLEARTHGELGRHRRLIQVAARSLQRLESQFRSGTKLERLKDPELQAAAKDEGFQTMTISASGDASYIGGVNAAPGVAHSLKNWSGVRGIASIGFTVGTSIGASGELQLGFWKDPVDRLTGWDWGVAAGGHYGAGLSVAGFWDMSDPPAFQGFVVGLGPGFGVEGEIGLGATEYMDTIARTTGDAAAVITGGATTGGAPLGGACKVGADCQGYRAPLGNAGGVACCNGSCVKTKRDYAGVWWCPAECRSGVFAPPGSCG